MRNTLSQTELSHLIEKLIPSDSNAAEKLQSFAEELIFLNPFFFEVGEIEAGWSNISFSASECKEIKTAITSQKMTQEWSTSYMLIHFYEIVNLTHIGNSEYKPTSADKKKRFNELDAWHFMSAYLQLLCRLTKQDKGHARKINTLCVRIRMALRRNSPQRIILDELINIHRQAQSPQQTYDAIVSLENRLQQQEASGELNTTHLSNKVSSIRLAYDVAINNLPFYSRKQAASRTKSQRLKKTSFEVDGEVLQKIQFFKEEKGSNVHSDELAAEQNDVFLLDNDFEPIEVVAKSAELQDWQVRQKNYHKNRNQFHFLTNTRFLSLSAYQLVFGEIWRKLHHHEDYIEKRAYAVLLLSLLSGRSINKVIAEISKEKSKRHWLAHENNQQATGCYIANRIDVTSNRREELHEYTQSQSAQFNLPLPVALDVVVSKKFTIDDAVIARLLKQLRENLSLPVLSKQHIDNGLFFVIKHQVKQVLHAHLITGTDVKHYAPLYYSSAETAAVIDSYHQAIYFLSESCAKDEKDTLIKECTRKLPSNQQKKFIGSQMALKKSVCIGFFKQLRSNLLYYSTKQHLDPESLVSHRYNQFNAYALWLWHVMQIQTGIRPVVDAPGLLNQFNFNKRLLWVSDKESSQSHISGRLIPISDFLMTALRDYMDYLKRFSVALYVIDDTMHYNYEAMMASKRPLIQLYGYRPKGFKGAKPSTIRGLLGKFMLHQDNWLRHQLRSMLTGVLPEDLTTLLFGHELDEQEVMHPMSSFALNEIYKITPYLDWAAKELRLEQVEVVF